MLFALKRKLASKNLVFKFIVRIDLHWSIVQQLSPSLEGLSCLRSSNTDWPRAEARWCSRPANKWIERRSINQKMKKNLDNFSSSSKIILPSSSIELRRGKHWLIKETFFVDNDDRQRRCCGCCGWQTNNELGNNYHVSIMNRWRCFKRKWVVGRIESSIVSCCSKTIIALSPKTLHMIMVAVCLPSTIIVWVSNGWICINGQCLEHRWSIERNVLLRAGQATQKIGSHARTWWSMVYY